MTVSVVVPTYNHRDTVLETLQSVLAQTYRDFELIVVNDGSPDDTAELLRPLAESGTIRYVEQPNAGQGAARNRGLHEARGEYVAFLDDDDLWPADKLQWQVEVLDADPECVLVYGRHAELRADGSLVPDGNSGFPTGRVERDFRRRNWIHSVGQTLIRTDAARELGGFDPTIWGADDWDLFVRLSRLGRFEFRDRVCLHYRLHESNASRHAVRHVRNYLRVARRHQGWNVPLRLSGHRAAGTYFVPNLLRAASELHAAGRHGAALQAVAYALTFRPRLLFDHRLLRAATRLCTGRRTARSPSA